MFKLKAHEIRAIILLIISSLFLSSALIAYLLCRKQTLTIGTFELTPIASQEVVGICSELFVYSFPSFAHVASLSLASYAFMAHVGRNIFVTALMWFFINLVFEIGQLLTSNDTLSGSSDSVQYFSFILNYLIQGHFDFMDIVFALLGAIVAVLVVYVFKLRD